MLRYVANVFKAMRMTLRGEAVDRPYGPLLDWMENTPPLVDDALTIAEENGMDEAGRKSFIVRADGRDQSMHTILETVKFHATQEYPYMFKNMSEHVITAIYASNLNDSYAVERLAASDSAMHNNLRQAISRLGNHLKAIPPSTDMGV